MDTVNPSTNKQPNPKKEHTHQAHKPQDNTSTTRTHTKKIFDQPYSDTQKIDTDHLKGQKLEIIKKHFRSHLNHLHEDKAIKTLSTHRY